MAEQYEQAVESLKFMKEIDKRRTEELYKSNVDEHQRRLNEFKEKISGETHSSKT